MKRKNDEARSPKWFLNIYVVVMLLAATVMIVGSLASLGLSNVVTMLKLAGSARDIVTQQPKLGRTPIPTNPTALPQAKPLDLPDTTGIVISLKSGFLAMHHDATFSPIAIQGTDAVSSPDGKQHLAYLRNDHLYIWQADHEQQIDTPFTPIMPSWNADGSALLFVARDASGDSVFRLDFNADHTSHELRYMLTVPEIAAPPIANPATARILIAEKTAATETIFYTVDSYCANLAACQQTRKQLAVVPYDVNWVDYHPTATSLVFSTSTDGKLYLLYGGTSRIEPIVPDTTFKRRPSFDPSGRYLTYLSQSNDLYALPLFPLSAGSSTPILWWQDVVSIDWANR